MPVASASTAATTWAPWLENSKPPPRGSGAALQDAAHRVGVGHVLRSPVAVEPGEPGRHREQLPQGGVGHVRAHVVRVVGQQLDQGRVGSGDVALLDGDPDQRRQDAAGGRVDVPVGVDGPVVVLLQHGLAVDLHEHRAQVVVVRVDLERLVDRRDQRCLVLGLSGFRVLVVRAGRHGHEREDQRGRERHHPAHSQHPVHQPRSRHSSTCGRSLPSTESLPWPG